MSAAADAPWRRFIADYCASPVAVLGLALFVVIVAAALCAPLLAPQDPYDLAQLDILDGGLAPGQAAMTGMVFHVGSDGQGRDMLSGILYGLRISLGVGALSTLIAMAIGLIAGLSAAYVGGLLDIVIMRVVDIQLSFPAILIALILIAVFGTGIEKVLIALVTVQWAYYARTVRGSALVERRKDYIEAARGLALPTWRILLRHLMPNCLPPLIVVATVQMASAIALEATLSFLGLGLEITKPSLGLLIANGFEDLQSGKYWISVFPGLALLLTILAINLVGDQVRDVLNPRLKR